ncbi:hypothetical protein BJX65DRAFT_284403 [Aspergillus insuetus]
MPPPFPTQFLAAFLEGSTAARWGFVIYRTTYTPYSSRRFPQLVNLFSSCMRRELFKEHASDRFDTTGRPIPDCRAMYDLIWARHRPVIMDDPAKFEGMTLDAVRSHFEGWVGPRPPAEEEERDVGTGVEVDFSRPPAQTHACLVVDEEVLRVLTRAKPPPKDVHVEHLMPTTWWVKAVEAYPDLEDDPPEVWDGTLKVPIRGLWRFWQQVDYPASMQLLTTNHGMFEA